MSVAHILPNAPVGRICVTPHQANSSKTRSVPFRANTEAIATRSQHTWTESRISNLVAIAATIVLGLGAGGANADTVSLEPWSSPTEATIAEPSTPVATLEESTVVDERERAAVNAEPTNASSTATTDAAVTTEDTSAGKKPTSRRGRIKELEDIKAELAKKELELLSKENALLEKEQSISVLRQELDIERKLRDLVTKEKEDAEEEALLSKSLCTGSTMLP